MKDHVYGRRRPSDHHLGIGEGRAQPVPTEQLSEVVGQLRQAVMALGRRVEALEKLAQEEEFYFPTAREIMKGQQP